MFASLAIAGLGWLVPLAGLLGVGSIGGLVYAVGPAVALGLAKKGLSAAWSRLSHRSLWQLVCLALAGLCILLWFQRNDARSDAARWEKQYHSLQTQADKIKRERDEANAKVSEEIRKRTDEENRRIAAGADDLRVSGPGRSRVACSPATPGGHVAPNGAGDVAGPQVPTDERAAVPWQWLVTRAEQADLNRAEVLAWRDWYARLAEQWNGKK